ncbi:collagen alpha-1(I) chain-like [Podarcis raffonei]|uniref:collagen alpha-1(I) chain-like n=1 Tax=Podarcis raffonei TaxID=65483 RepID=UPI0023294001|nr:collagen alpha-1(I) chain-like [Podarcis raffonei]
MDCTTPRPRGDDARPAPALAGRRAPHAAEGTRRGRPPRFRRPAPCGPPEFPSSRPARPRGPRTADGPAPGVVRGGRQRQGAASGAPRPAEKGERVAAPPPRVGRSLPPCPAPVCPVTGRPPEEEDPAATRATAHPSSRSPAETAAAACLPACRAAPGRPPARAPGGAPSASTGGHRRRPEGSPAPCPPRKRGRAAGHRPRPPTGRAARGRRRAARAASLRPPGGWGRRRGTPLDRSPARRPPFPPARVRAGRGSAARTPAPSRPAASRVGGLGSLVGSARHGGSEPRLGATARALALAASACAASSFAYATGRINQVAALDPRSLVGGTGLGGRRRHAASRGRPLGRDPAGGRAGLRERSRPGSPGGERPRGARDTTTTTGTTQPGEREKDALAETSGRREDAGAEGTAGARRPRHRLRLGGPLDPTPTPGGGGRGEAVGAARPRKDGARDVAEAAPPGSGHRAWIGSLSEGDATPDGRGEGEASAPPERQSPAGPRRALPDATIAARVATWALSPLPNAGSAPPRGSPHPHSREKLGNAAAATGAQGPLEGPRSWSRDRSPPPAALPPRRPSPGRDPKASGTGSEKEAARRCSEGTASDAAPAPRRGSTLAVERGWVVFGSPRKNRVGRRACPCRGSTLAVERGWVVFGSTRKGPENPVARNLRAHAVLARREPTASRAPAPAPRQADVSEAPGGQTRQTRSGKRLRGSPVVPVYPCAASRAPAPAPRQAGVSEAPGGQTRQTRSGKRLRGFPVVPVYPCAGAAVDRSRRPASASRRRAEGGGREVAGGPGLPAGKRGWLGRSSRRRKGRKRRPFSWGAAGSSSPPEGPAARPVLPAAGALRSSPVYPPEACRPPGLLARATVFPAERAGGRAGLRTLSSPPLALPGPLPRTGCLPVYPAKAQSASRVHGPPGLPALGTPPVGRPAGRPGKLGLVGPLPRTECLPVYPAKAQSASRVHGHPGLPSLGFHSSRPAGEAASCRSTSEEGRLPGRPDGGPVGSSRPRSRLPACLPACLPDWGFQLYLEDRRLPVLPCLGLGSAGPPDGRTGTAARSPSRAGETGACRSTSENGRRMEARRERLAEGAKAVEGQASERLCGSGPCPIQGRGCRWPRSTGRQAGVGGPVFPAEGGEALDVFLGGGRV